jgi:hypothetical protein
MLIPIQKFSASTLKYTTKEKNNLFPKKKEKEKKNLLLGEFQSWHQPAEISKHFYWA